MRNHLDLLTFRKPSGVLLWGAQMRTSKKVILTVLCYVFTDCFVSFRWSIHWPDHQEKDPEAGRQKVNIICDLSMLFTANATDLCHSGLNFIQKLCALHYWTCKIKAPITSNHFISWTFSPSDFAHLITLKTRNPAVVRANACLIHWKLLLSISADTLSHPSLSTGTVAEI